MPIDLGYVIGQMNSAEADSRRGIGRPRSQGLGDVQDEPLKTLQRPNSGQAEFEAEKQQKSKVKAEILNQTSAVDPLAQTSLIQLLDLPSQQFVLGAYTAAQAKNSGGVA